MPAPQRGSSSSSACGVSPPYSHTRCPALGAGAVAGHQLRSVDAVREVLPERPQRPHEWLAVRHDQRRSEECIAGRGIVTADHQRVDGDRAHVAGTALGDHGIHRVHRAVVVGQREGDSENLPLSDRAGRPIAPERSQRCPGPEELTSRWFRWSGGSSMRSRSGSPPATGRHPPTIRRGPARRGCSRPASLVQQLAQARGLVVLLGVVTLLARRL